ncbi:regulator of chromosome condensation-like protein [Sarcoptes scabiei]|uniref:Regulator of chromosome condensation-like protein n=1 Tax=Sarcoptes scabiei TaxID=52283 RepID=A0A131ZU89_SARSC|nr:regulator of chromosome condensation-like protein [Sarcoptes scabiei]
MPSQIWHLKRNVTFSVPEVTETEKINSDPPKNSQKRGRKATPSSKSEDEKISENPSTPRRSSRSATRASTAATSSAIKTSPPKIAVTSPKKRSTKKNSDITANEKESKAVPVKGRNFKTNEIKNDKKSTPSKKQPSKQKEVSSEKSSTSSRSARIAARNKKTSAEVEISNQSVPNRSRKRTVKSDDHETDESATSTSKRNVTVSKKPRIEKVAVKKRNKKTSSNGEVKNISESDGQLEPLIEIMTKMDESEAAAENHESDVKKLNENSVSVEAIKEIKISRPKKAPITKKTKSKSTAKQKNEIVDNEKIDKADIDEQSNQKTILAKSYNAIEIIDDDLMVPRDAYKLSSDSDVPTPQNSTFDKQETKAVVIDDHVKQVNDESSLDKFEPHENDKKLLKTIESTFEEFNIPEIRKEIEPAFSNDIVGTDDDEHLIGNDGDKLENSKNNIDHTDDSNTIKKPISSLNNLDQKEKLIHDEMARVLKRKAQDVVEETMPDKKRIKLEELGCLFTMGDQISKELGPRQIFFQGRKTLRNQPARVKLNGICRIVKVATGALHTLAIAEDGRVFSFGCNDDFALGRLLRIEEIHNGKIDDSDEFDFDLDENDDEIEEKLSGIPLPVKEIKSKAIKVTAGDMHSAALCQDGKVYIWGNFKDESNKIGLFSDSSKSPTSSDYLPTMFPTLLNFDKNVVDIASGSHHLLLLTDEGKVYTFGEGSKGQLGRIVSTELNSIQANRELFLKPQSVCIPDNAQIAHVFASQWNSFALTEDGILYGWGLNNYYQLGIKNEFVSQANSLNSGSLYTLIPTRIPVKYKITQAANGQQHSLILDLDGKVYSCGSTLYGKTGHGEDFVKECGEDKSISEFKQIKQSSFNEEKVVQIDCGDFCSMAITESGKLFCWGQGGKHIGTDDGIDLFEPQSVKGPYAECTKFTMVSTGSNMASIIGTIQNDDNSSKD